MRSCDPIRRGLGIYADWQVAVCSTGLSAEVVCCISLCAYLILESSSYGRNRFGILPYPRGVSEQEVRLLAGKSEITGLLLSRLKIPFVAPAKQQP